MNVLMAPDWRGHNPYQTHLANALSAHGVEVEFKRGTRRGLPVSRLLRDQPCDVFHLHWPESFWQGTGAWHRVIQQTRFPLDLTLATRRTPLVYTAHNLFPHDRAPCGTVRRAIHSVLCQASAIIAHSNAARDALRQCEPQADGRIHVIPHGDLLGDLTTPDHIMCRRQIGHSDESQVVLMFGVIKPYKGLAEIAREWHRMPGNWCLRIVGSADDDSALLAELRSIEHHLPARVKVIATRLSDDELYAEIAAANVVLLNYHRILTSGAACLARSIGTPIVLPARCTTVDLREPSPTVFRFKSIETDLVNQIDRALKAPRAMSDIGIWREHISWKRVAGLTAEVYRSILSDSK